MAYVRLTVAHPRPERLAEVRKHYEELVAYVAKKPGYIAGWVMVPHENPNEVGRMTIWEDQTAANAAANDPHAMALHSELEFDVQGNTWDRSYDGIPPKG